MAKYTMELRQIVAHYATSVDWSPAYPHIGLDQYAIYDEAHRKTLNDKIIRHYYMHEIGMETVELFKFEMNEAMQLIMPYYNELFQSKLITIDRLLGRSKLETEKFIRDLGRGVVTSGTSESEGSTKVTGSTSDSTLSKYLDTPQNDVQNIEDGYLTWVQKDNVDGTSDTFTNQTDSGKTTGNSDEKVNESHDVTRDTQEIDPSLFKNIVGIGRQLLNIDDMIVRDRNIRECFMQIW